MCGAEKKRPTNPELQSFWFFNLVEISPRNNKKQPKKVQKKKQQITSTIENEQERKATHVFRSRIKTKFWKRKHIYSFISPFWLFFEWKVAFCPNECVCLSTKNELPWSRNNSKKMSLRQLSKIQTNRILLFYWWFNVNSQVPF